MFRGCLPSTKSANRMFEPNNGECIFERGTFLPLRQQLADLKRAGVDLEARQQAYSTFTAGERVNLYSDDELDEFTEDELDLYNRKLAYFDYFEKQALFLAQKQNLEMTEKVNQENKSDIPSVANEAQRSKASEE